MSAHAVVDRHRDERFDGRNLPFHVYATPSLILLGLVGVFAALGLDPDARLIALTVLAVGLSSLAYVGSRFRNYVSLHPKHLTISVWVLVPLGSHQVSYDKISRIEADDASGNLALWFENEDGESDAAEIVLKVPSSAAALKDAIRRRQESGATYHGAATRSNADRLNVGAVPPSPGDKRQYSVETPAWMKWAAVAGALVGGAAAFANAGDFSLNEFLGLVIFFCVMGLILAGIAKFQTYLVLHADRVDMGWGLGDKHRIKFADVVEVSGSEEGWLSVTYTKKATLGIGGGKTEAGIRVRPHSMAQVVAEAIELGRQRARSPHQADIAA